MAKLILTHADAVKKIQSIKAVRSATGLSLKDAKYIVDTFTENWNPIPLMDDLTVEDAESRLKELKAEGYANGRVEVSARETMQDFTLALKLADTIAMARNTDWSPSKIINEMLDNPEKV